jgi:hypothetical protein
MKEIWQHIQGCKQPNCTVSLSGYSGIGGL